MNGPNKQVLHYTWLERLAMDKQSNLLGKFVSYEENKVLWIQPQAFKGPAHFFEISYIIEGATERVYKSLNASFITLIVISSYSLS